MPNVANVAPLCISIVTVVKNGGQFIGETIQSVLSQDYLEKEYIIIDGGSTDSTLDIIKSYGEDITQWISEPDRGIAEAFNKGVARATGDYLLMLNADDALMRPDTLSKVAERIRSENFPAMLYGDCELVDRDSGQLVQRISVNLSPRKIRYGQILPHPALFTHRSYFDRYGDFDATYRIAMDYEWMLRGMTRERVVHVPVIVSRIRSGGVSTRNRRLAVEEIIRAQQKNGLITSRLDATLIRSYFGVRGALRNTLEVLGLYGLMNRFRKQGR